MLKYIILALAFIGIVFFVLFKFEKLDKPEKKKSIYILIAVLILSLVFTVLYSSRLLTTLISKRGKANTGNNENSLYYLIPLIFLAALSLFGPITKDLYFNSLSGEALSISNTFLLSIQVSIFLIFIIYYFM